MKIKFLIKQSFKMLAHNMILPCIYKYYCRQSIAKGKIIFADAHNDSLPYSMQAIFSLLKDNYRIELWTQDYAGLKWRQLAGTLLRFMKSYATAEYVFICDNFLPVSSCKKRAETKVIQLWHSGGLLKKMAYDTAEDIPNYYHGEVYRNYSLVTVSAPCCVAIWAKAMHVPASIVRPLGISRTDIYYNKNWISECKKDFYRIYPEAFGKHVVLWAPTFRGNASTPELCGLREMRWLQEQLKEEYFFIFKLHPHLQDKAVFKCNIATENLLPVADILITDYSSVLFDFLIFNRPIVLFAPDFKKYQRSRGFYIEYKSLPAPIARTAEELLAIMEEKTWNSYVPLLKNCKKHYMQFCDGHATERILKELKLTKIRRNANETLF